MSTPALNPNAVGVGLRQPHYRTVLETLPAVDFLEVHAENFMSLHKPMGGAAAAVLAQARSHYPISLHGVGLSLGSAQGLDAAHVQAFAQLVAHCEPVLISDHLCFGRAQLETGFVHSNDLLPARLTRQSLDIFSRNITQLQDTLKRPIAVENISSYIQWRDADYSELEFINTLAQRTGCGVLLDLNNVYVNALNITDAQATPLARCMAWVDGLHKRPSEIHLAGYSATTGMVIDDHSAPVADPVWDLYVHALARFGAVPTLIEWDTQLPEFEVLLGEAHHARRLQPCLQA